MHHPAGGRAAQRAQAHRLLQDPSLSVGAIARQLGIPRQAVERWNARSGVRPPRPRPGTLAAWSSARREAAVRLLSAADIDPVDVVVAMGFARTAAPILLATFGLRGHATRPAPMGEAPETRAVDPVRLRARLRAHIGRQIEILDAALSDAPKAGFDSAKILRDLGGLKRLLDDLGSGDGGQGEGEPRDEPAQDGTGDGALDLDQLRAEIARRFDRFVAGETTA